MLSLWNSLKNALLKPTSRNVKSVAVAEENSDNKVTSNPKLMLAIKTAFKLYGTRYNWGGQTPMGGLDCSGFICVVFSSIGLIGNREDLSSSMLAKKFPNEIKEPKRGDLAFYGKKHITHVALFIDNQHIIEAAGGGSNTRSMEDAILQQAYVRIRPYKYRGDLLKITRPEY